MKVLSTTLLRFALAALLILPAVALAQDAPVTEAPEKPKREYVRGTFETGILIDNQTVVAPRKKNLEFIIEHRFGLVENADDLFGFYAPANIRLGLNYGITDRISVGVGVTKNKMIYDFNGKLLLLRQTTDNAVPVTLSYYGNVGRSASDETNWYSTEGADAFKNSFRLSYFNQLMIARKFNNRISAQLSFSYAHHNVVDSLYGQHDFMGASFAGRYKFSPQSSVIINADYLINGSGIDESVQPKPNLGIGYEVSTGSHQFQVFVASASNIMNQEILVYNQNDLFNGDYLFGFNITRSWGFK